MHKFISLDRLRRRTRARDIEELCAEAARLDKDSSIRMKYWGRGRERVDLN
jgi:hypothetical protein